MYEIFLSPRFKKDLKKIQKRPKDYELTRKFIILLKENGIKGIPATLKPHKFHGNYKGLLEAHIKPDLLIIWFQIESPREITLIRIGSHSDLF